jgi:L-methionine (R)-S-oxide reductase
MSAYEILTEPTSDFETICQKLVEYLYEKFPIYDWIGIYWLEEGHLKLKSWKGEKPTEHTEIPLGVGLCGLAAQEGKTIRSDSVKTDPRYLACFPETESEIVVPIKSGDKILGEIDIDSKLPSAFSELDQEYLETLAFLLAKKWEEESSSTL